MLLMEAWSAIWIWTAAMTMEVVLVVVVMLRLLLATRSSGRDEAVPTRE
jgi:hypothetical protein